ncbi:MAG: HPP family protein [Oscillospiraceae bacterium]|jgi:CBS-domain-containing membrane protein|nr:HPP family protein [Oscillospiraceae bacterium]
MFSKIKEAISAQIKESRERDNLGSVAAQCVIVFVSLGLILALYEFFGGIIVASLGASSFILFVTPRTNSSRARNLIGGYIFGSLAGVTFSVLHVSLDMFDVPGMHLTLILGCAAAAALATFLMACTGLVHPPAAALALGLAADSACLRTALAALVGVTVLCAVRRLLIKNLKNLV